MGMTLVKKVGKVRIKRQERDGALYACRWSPTARRIITERIPSDNLNTATKRAAEINAQIKKGTKAVVEAQDKVGIRAALDVGVANSKSRDAGHQWNLKAWAGYFSEWLSTDRPELVRWDQMTYAIFCDYVEYLRDVKKISPKAASNYCSVIGITSRYWSRHHPRLYVPIPVSHPWFSEAESPKKKYLTTEQALALLAFARRRNAKTDTGLLTIALGCFGGLNLKEIANCRVGWIDAENCVIDVRKSKNVGRVRRIPVVPLIRTILAEATAGRDPEELLIRPLSDKIPTHKTLSNNLREHLLPAAAKELNCENYLNIAPKDVRKTFANIMVSAKVDKLTREAYFGHAANTTFKKIYGDEALIEKFRTEVVEPVQRHLQQVHKHERGQEYVASTVKLIPDDEFTLDDLVEVS